MGLPFFDGPRMDHDEQASILVGSSSCCDRHILACLYSLFHCVSVSEREKPTKHIAFFHHGFSTQHAFELKHGNSKTRRESRFFSRFLGTRRREKRNETPPE
jgi:hypothetical protein